MNKIILITLTVLVTGVIMFNLFTKKSGGMNLTADEFKQKIETQPGMVIDVRTQAEYNEEHLAMVDGNHDLLNGDFEAQLENLDKNETYYLYCRSGNRSGKAAKMMKDRGFEKVYNIGGFPNLKSSGIETKK